MSVVGEIMCEIFNGVEKSVKDWWCDLQQERKCNSTNTISKVVNKLEPDDQEKIRIVISQEIDKLISECESTKDIKILQGTCNAINGCFDNFVHAADAVRMSFETVISFINFGIEECALDLSSNNVVNSMSKGLELLHCISRILVLVLKLKRPGKQKCDDKGINENTRATLLKLANNIGPFLVMGDLSMDSKNNFAMAAILIREITMSEEDLIHYHKHFVQTIPTSLEDTQYKLNILKFLLSSAIINTWSVNIIDSDSTNVYLNFFIMLSEKYSKETPVVLNTSRTLFLLIKNDCFANYVNNLNSDDDYKTFELLLTCLWMLLEHPVACVRNSAKDYLQVLVAYPKLQEYIIESVFNLPKEKRSFYIGVASMANEIGTRNLVENYKDLPKLLLSSVSDPTIASHVSFALEKLILNDELSDNDLSKWCELWIIPLLISLTTVLPIVAADIEKLIEKAFKKNPNAILYIIKKWANPKTGEELRYVITALKISHKQGYKLKTNSEVGGERQSAVAVNNAGTKWKNLISERLLRECLHHGDDDIRMSAFSLIIEGHKTTEAYTPQDFELIQYFLRYNLNNQQPATRQKILGIVRKMLVRFTESRVTLRKGGKSIPERRQKADTLVAYENFKNWLIEFCFSNIFPGANFNRLSTVLNILILSFDNIDNMEFSPGSVNYYWKKILIVLESSYEENKEMAVTISKKLDCSQLDANKLEYAKTLFAKAFDYCTHMEPPDVLTGTYLLLVLLNLPCSKDILLEFTSGDHADCDEKFISVQILKKKLEEQVEFAKDNLMTAAVTGPMYGTLFAIRLLLRSVDFLGIKKKENLGEGEPSSSLEDWSKVVNELIDLSFQMSDIVSVVVNSSSPEGHLPMDFQSDFENLLSGTLDDAKEETEENNGDDEELPLDDGGDVSNEEDSPKKSKKNVNLHFSQALRLVTKHSSLFINKLEGVEGMMKEPDANIEEIVTSLNSLFIDNKHLIRKWKQIKLGRKKFYQPTDSNYKNETEKEGCDDCNHLKILIEKKKLLVRYLEKYGVNKKGATSTAQVLLLCSWRSIKEASLYLGDLVSKVPIETAIELKLLTEETIIKIGDKLRILLCEIKHRGAFEQAYIGFTQLITALWKCPITTLNELPNKWLEEIIQQLKSPHEEPKLKFCPTRRSAGLPFMIQAIIATEVQLTKSAVAHTLHNTMNSLLEIAENVTEETTESRIHSLNILRALFKHAQLGESIAPYVSRALMIAIRGSRADTWSERNSSSLLFSSLMIRIFGVARSRDEISKKNRMTSRTFFQRYAELYDFLLSEVEMFCVQDQSNGYYPQPTLYLILLILGRLYPSPSEDIEKVDLSVFVPIINSSASNPTMKIRELGARALISLIPSDRLFQELDERFSTLGLKKNISQNERHGILLQVKALITETSDLSALLQSQDLQTKAKTWLENTKWFLDFDIKSKKPLSYIVMSTYIQVLHLLFKKCQQLRSTVENIILDSNLTKRMVKFLPSSSFDKKSAGIYLFLENFYFLKLDVTAITWLDSNTLQNDKLCQLILTMLKCGISEVQALPLRLLRFLLRDVEDFDFDDDEDESFSVPIKDLICLQDKKHAETLQYHIFSYSPVKNYIAKCTSDSTCPHFQERVIHRLWAQVATMLLFKNAISMNHSYGCSVQLDDLDFHFYTNLLKKNDNSLTNYGIIGLGIFFMEEFEHSKSLKYYDLFCFLIRKYFIAEKDLKCRIAVAKILTKYCKNVTSMFFSREPKLLLTCMIPVQLLVDDNALVRKLMMKFVYLLIEEKNQDVAEKKGVKQRELFDCNNFNLVPLRAQEKVIDCLIYLFGQKNLMRDFLCQLLRLGLSAWVENRKNKPVCEDEKEEEVGVFEKGNPNPFSEELAMTDLVCEKINYINSALDVRKLLTAEFTENSVKNFREFFYISKTDSLPKNTLQIVEIITRYIQMEDATSSVENYCSIPRLQIEKIRKSFEMELVNKNIKSTVALGGIGEILGGTAF